MIIEVNIGDLREPTEAEIEESAECNFDPMQLEKACHADRVRFVIEDRLRRKVEAVDRANGYRTDFTAVLTRDLAHLGIEVLDACDWEAGTCTWAASR